MLKERSSFGLWTKLLECLSVIESRVDKETQCLRETAAIALGAVAKLACIGRTALTCLRCNKRTIFP
ncbi:hypothetical protein M0804_010698 [Polistes exclamans]|nr:hypothetical protein M0804_010698 [Polistes exclamans]